jgi:hypothetical protein
MEKKSGLMKRVSVHKGSVMLVVQLLVCGIMVFAQSSEGIKELDDWGTNVMSLITSSWVQAICALAFAIEAGAMIYAGRQGESGVVKKFIPWMIGTIGLLSASAITGFFFGKTA